MQVIQGARQLRCIERHGVFPEPVNLVEPAAQVAAGAQLEEEVKVGIVCAVPVDHHDERVLRRGTKS